MALALALLGVAHAQVDVQRSLLDGGDWLYLREPVLGVPWSPAATVSYQSARGLAVLETASGTVPVLPTVGTAEVAASLVLGSVARVGVTAPWHHGEGLDGGVGDVSAWASFAVTDQDGEGLEGTWTVQYDAPTGRVPLLMGPGSLQGTMAFGGDAGPGRWAGQLGLQLHREVELPGTSWQDGWLFGGGYRLPLGPGRVGAELAGRMPARVLRPNPADVPVEGALVAGVLLRDLVLVQGSVGTGLLRGLGSPSMRAVGSVDVRARRLRDRDGDGVADAVDRCRAEPEDRDGFRDGDGCPDEDNDGDGLLDGVDACPDRAENANGVDDGDGCPEAAMWLVLTVRADVAEVEVRLGDEVWRQPTGVAVEHVVRELPMLPLTVRAEGHRVVQDLFDGLGKERVAKEVVLEPQAIEVVDGALALPEPVFFAIDAAEVEDPDGLEPVLDWLAAHPAARLQVVGRADARGDAAYNQQLSERRSAWVVGWLVDHGVDPRRLQAMGLGEADAVGVDADRRVGFRVVD